MFESKTSTFTSFVSGESITDPSANYLPDYYKGWRITGNTFNIATVTGNTATTIYFDGVISGNGPYTLSLITKEDLLEKYPDIEDTKVLDSDGHLSSVNEAITVFGQDVALSHPNKTVFNLVALKDAFIYYVLSSIYFKLDKGNDGAYLKASKDFDSMYSRLYNLGINHVHVDSDNSGAINEVEAVPTRQGFEVAVW